MELGIQAEANALIEAESLRRDPAKPNGLDEREFRINP